MATIVVSPSIHETDYNGNGDEEGRSKLLEHLAVFDADFRVALVNATTEFADDPYSDNVSDARRRRRRQLQIGDGGYSPFEVEYVESVLTYGALR